MLHKYANRDFTFCTASQTGGGSMGGLVTSIGRLTHSGDPAPVAVPRRSSLASLYLRGALFKDRGTILTMFIFIQVIHVPPGDRHDPAAQVFLQ